MFDELQSYSLSDVEAASSFQLPTLQHNSEQLANLVKLLSQFALRQPFQQLYKKAKQSYRKGNLAYVFIDRLPVKYRKDMINIVDYYERELLNRATELQRADIRLQEARKKVKPQIKEVEMGFWERTGVRTLQVECRQLKQTIIDLQEQLQTERTKKPNLDTSAITTCDHSVHEVVIPSPFQPELTRLKEQLRYYSDRQQQSNQSMSTLVSQLVDHENTIQTLNRQLVEKKELRHKLGQAECQNIRLQEEIINLKEKIAECVREGEEVAMQNQMLEGNRSDLEREIRRLKTDLLRMEIGEAYKDHKVSLSHSMNNLGNMKELEDYYSPIQQEFKHQRSKSRQTCDAPKTKFTLSSLKNVIKLAPMAHETAQFTALSKTHTRSVI